MIFNLFKSKPTLKELIPDGFVDIHSHILPGIDDGAKNVEESLKMISEMKKLGFSKIIGTPHTYPGLYNNTNKIIYNSYLKIKDKIKNHNISTSIASEYMIDNSLIEKAENKNLLCLKDNYVLIEFNFINESYDYKEILFKIQLNEYRPIIAHPERYLYWFNDFKKLRELKRNGCKFQLNFLSITGYYGKKVLEMANKLIKNNMIDFVGSDFHNLNHIKQTDKKIKIQNIRKLEGLFNNTEFL